MKSVNPIQQAADMSGKRRRVDNSKRSKPHASTLNQKSMKSCAIYATPTQMYIDKEKAQSQQNGNSKREIFKHFKLHLYQGLQ